MENEIKTTPHAERSLQHRFPHAKRSCKLSVAGALRGFNPRILFFTINFSLFTIHYSLFTILLKTPEIQPPIPP